MGRKIPEPIRREVLRKWLEGKSRNLNAKECDIGTGTVSEIIKEYQQKDADLELLRQVAVHLRHQGTKIQVFSKAVRLKAILDERGLDEDQIESLIVNAETHCFRRKIEPQQFFNNIDEICTYSNNAGRKLSDLPLLIKQQQNHLQQLNNQVKEAGIKTSQAFQYYDATLQELENYRKDKPLRERIFQLELELKTVKEEKHHLLEQFFGERIQNVASKERWSLSENELDETNKQLLKNENSPPISSEELLKMANQLYRRPSRYVDIINTMRHSMRSEKAES